MGDVEMPSSARSPSSSEIPRLKGVLLEKIGKAIFDIDFGLEEMEKALFYYTNIEK